MKISICLPLTFRVSVLRYNQLKNKLKKLIEKPKMHQINTQMVRNKVATFKNISLYLCIKP